VSARRSAPARVLDYFRTEDLDVALAIVVQAGQIVDERRDAAKAPQAVKRTRRPRAAGAPSQSASATASSTQEA
jgi:hypothetical protein